MSIERITIQLARLDEIQGEIRKKADKPTFEELVARTATPMASGYERGSMPIRSKGIVARR